MSGGVKNLRAMFEQKGVESSPIGTPDRGRSPGVPFSDSPRPLSKVRTSFIAIEKDGRIGLQRDSSRESSISATRKLSGDSDTSTLPSLKETADASRDNMETTAAKTDISPKSTLQPSPTGSGNKGLAPSPEFIPAQKTQAPSAVSGGSNGLGVNGSGEKTPTSSNDVEQDTKAELVSKTSDDQDKEKATAEQIPNASNKVATKAAPKPLAAPSSSKVSRPAKSPTVTKAPKSPTETSTPRFTAKTTPERNVRQPEKLGTPRKTTSTPRASAPNSIKRPPPLQGSPATAGSGFVKPKPKSPTRPIRLPESLTTHTAASGSKINAPRQTLSRAGGAVHGVDTAGRPLSRAGSSVAGTTRSNSTEKTTLKRQSSTINRARPSLGLPPKQTAKDQPPMRKEKEVDEGFLARMMRPTQASASKMTEKVPLSPPRKPSVAPNGRKPVSKAEPRPVKKPVGKTTASSASSHAPPGSAAYGIASKVEQAVTAEEATKVARGTEGEVTLPADAVAQPKEKYITTNGKSATSEPQEAQPQLGIAALKAQDQGSVGGSMREEAELAVSEDAPPAGSTVEHTTVEETKEAKVAPSVEKADDDDVVAQTSEEKAAANTTEVVELDPAPEVASS